MSGTPVRRLGRVAVAVVVRHRFVWAPAVAYAAAVAAVLLGTGLGRLWSVQWHYPVLDVLFVGWGAGLAVVAFGNRRLVETLSPERIAGAALVWLLIPMFCDSFSSWKQGMWYLVPFRWDAAFHVIDVRIHGGVAPALWLLPLLGAVSVRVLDVVYGAWFLVVMTTIAAVAWGRESRARHQFLISVVLGWIVLGSVLAACFGSVGPCYYDKVVGGANPYSALFERLDGFTDPPLLARRFQASLWDWQASGHWHFFGGISAMPSLHVAMATTVALAWARRGAWGALPGVAFVAATLIGSVVLGWHYAIDGYVGVASAGLAWFGAGRLAARVVASESVYTGGSVRADARVER